jgi:lysophospholipase L1-like esterase
MSWADRRWRVRRWTDRRRAVVIGVLALVTIACKTPGGGPGFGEQPPPTPTRGFPSSMVALGDSITSGFGSCFAPTSCPRNSWATGDGTRVTSHYRRIKLANPAITGHARNLAVPGARAADLGGQATSAARVPADYVTILVGANDACRGEMTPATQFRRSIDTALGTLKRGLPTARLLLVSIPNVYGVWEVGHGNELATKVWRSGVCPNLLGNATSTATLDVNRRRAFKDRIAAYNIELRRACAAYGSKCRFENMANFAFDLGMLSAIDFFHPNAAGHTALADQTYPGRFTW